MKNTRSSIYQLFAQQNLSSDERKSILAMDCLGCEPMTYGEMEISLHALGSALDTVCEGEEVITHCGLTTPDAVLSFWAANAVGKKINYVFPEFIAMDPVGYVESTGTKTLVILDIFYPKVAEALRRIKLERVVISSLADYAKPTIDPALPDNLKAMLSRSLYAEIRDNTPDNVGYELMSWGEFVGYGAGKTLTEAELSRVASDDVAGIFYTGGSTGRPKGIQLTNEGMRIMHGIYGLEKDFFDLQPGDRMFTHAPMPHATSAVHTVIMLMLHGCTLAMQPIFDTRRLLDDVRLLRPNHILASTSSHLPVTMREDLNAGELSYVKRVFSGAEKLFEKDARKIDSAYQKAGVQHHLNNGCGMSEFGTMTLIGGENSLNWMLPIPTVEHRLLDEEGRVIVGDGVGRHQTRTPARMLGYMNNPTGTATFFDVGASSGEGGTSFNNIHNDENSNIKR